MKFTFTLIFSVLIIGLNAQMPDSEIHKIPAIELKSVVEHLDSSVINYYTIKSLERKRTVSTELDSVVIPVFTDSILEARLKSINSIISLDYNDRTKAFINMYTGRKRDIVPAILGLSNYYFPMFEAELDKRQMPLELKYVPVIESALKPRAVSKAGAVGLWQFMYATAKMNGLTITSYVDERKDPLKSTEAACKYLGDLYGMFGDWQMAIAAYNCGPGNVNKAIRRSGGKTNFWEIYNYLPRETRGYVPAFIAAVYFFEYHEAHNIAIDEIDLPLVIDTVNVESYVHLKDVAEHLNVDIELIRELNPQYRIDIIPASKSRPYALILPMKDALIFSNFNDTLSKQYIARQGDRTSSPVSYSNTNHTVAGKTVVYYTVKSGDNLGYIADWYDTYVSSIKSWNGLYSTNIRVGQKIKVYVSTDKISYYSSINNMSFEEKKNIASHSKFENSSSGSVSSDSYIYYTFRSGDTLWDLTQKYPGNSINSIMTLNDISNVRNIKAGQQIKLKKI